MNKEQHRRDLLGVGRTLLCIMFIFFLVNYIASIPLGNKSFLFCFNITCAIGTIIIIAVLDIFKDKIIEGKFT